MVQLDTEQSGISLCFVFIITYYPVAEQRKITNCTVPRIKLNHNICTQTSLTESLLLLLQKTDHGPKRIVWKAYIIFVQLLLFKCDGAYSIFGSADSTLLEKY